MTKKTFYISLFFNVLLLGVILGAFVCRPMMMPPFGGRPMPHLDSPKADGVVKNAFEKMRTEGDRLHKAMEQNRKVVDKLMGETVFDRAAFDRQAETLRAALIAHHEAMTDIFASLGEKLSASERRELMEQIMQMPMPRGGFRGGPPPGGPGGMGDIPEQLRDAPVPDKVFGEGPLPPPESEPHP